MPISRERFEQGLTAEQYIDKMEKYRDRFLENLKIDESIITDKDREIFGRQPLWIAAIGEDWCTDVVQFLPQVIDLARQVPSITLRIFLRDQNPDLMDQYLMDGQYRSIPVFVLYDQDWNELGHFSERPEKVRKEMAEETRRFAQEHQDLDGINRAYANMPEPTKSIVRDNNHRYRWENMVRWNRIFLDDLAQIASRAGAASKR